MKKAFGGMARVLGLALIVAGISATASATPPVLTPEIDPGSMGSALTLLVGGALWLTGKGRKA